MNGEITTDKYHLLHAIRPVNLLLLSITIFVFHSAPVGTEIKAHNLTESLKILDIFLLCIASVCLAGSGNLINDFFDYEADKLKETKKQFNYKSAYLIYYYVSLGLGLICTSFLLHRQDALNYILIYFIIAAILFLYSSHLKSSILVGNLIIAFMTSIAFPLVYAFEYSALQNMPTLQNQLLNFTLFFSAFALITNLIREIVKDKLDAEIDAQAGIITLANSYKTKSLNLLLAFLSLILISLISYWFYDTYQSELKFNVLLAGIFILAPAISLAYRIFNIKTMQDFKLVSSLCKLNMAEALIYLILIPWI